MSGWGWVGAGQALREAGNAFRGYQQDVRRNNETDREWELRKKAVEDEMRSRAVGEALREKEYNLAVESGQRANEALGLQRETHTRQMQGDIREQIARLGAGGEVPQSLVADAGKYGISDQVINNLPGGRTMAPGQPPVQEGLGPEFLIGENYAKEMRTPDQVQEAGRASEEHASNLAYRDILGESSLMNAQANMLNATTNRDNPRSAMRPELARQFPVLAQQVRALQTALGNAQKKTLDVAAMAMPATRDQITAEIEAITSELESTKQVYDLSLQAILSEGLNPKVDVDPLQAIRDAIGAPGRTGAAPTTPSGAPIVPTPPPRLQGSIFPR